MVSISSLNVILLFKFSPWINLIFRFFSINNVASSVILFFCLFERLYKYLNLNACGVCVKIELFRFKLKIWFFILYLIESLGFIEGITALLFLSDLINFFKSLFVKLGLAASWIRTLLGLNFLIYFKAIKEESDLSLPPLTTETFLGSFSLIFFLLFTTNTIFLNSFDLMAFSKECLKRGLFL